jgi:hypothetical protein
MSGLYITVTLTCAKCGTEANEISQDPEYTGERAIEDNGWGYADNDVMMNELLCYDCLEDN